MLKWFIHCRHGLLADFLFLVQRSIEFIAITKHKYQMHTAGTWNGKTNDTKHKLQERFHQLDDQLLWPGCFSWLKIREGSFSTLSCCLPRGTCSLRLRTWFLRQQSAVRQCLPLFVWVDFRMRSCKHWMHVSRQGQRARESGATVSCFQFQLEKPFQEFRFCEDSLLWQKLRPKDLARLVRCRS